MGNAYVRMGELEEGVAFWFPPNWALLQDFKNLVPANLRKFDWGKGCWIVKEDGRRLLHVLIKEHNAKVGQWHASL